MFADTIARVTRDEKQTRGQRLRSAMEERGLRTNDLNRVARRRDGSGLSPGYVSRFASDAWESPGIEEVAALATALGVSLTWLAWGDGDMNGTTEMAKGRAKPMLEAVLTALNSKGRWTPPTVAAARAMPRDIDPSDWPAVLDRIEKELAPVIAKLERGGK